MGQNKVKYTFVLFINFLYDPGSWSSTTGTTGVEAGGDWCVGVGV